MKYGILIASVVLFVIAIGVGCDSSDPSKENAISVKNVNPRALDILIEPETFVPVHVKQNKVGYDAEEGIDYVNLKTNDDMEILRRNALAVVANRQMLGKRPLIKLSGSMVQKGELSGRISMFLGSGSGSISGKSYPEMIVMYACSFGDSVNIGMLPVSKVDFLVNDETKNNTIRLQFDLTMFTLPPYPLFNITNKMKARVERLTNGEIMQSKYIDKAIIYISQSDLESSLYVKFFTK